MFQTLEQEVKLSQVPLSSSELLMWCASALLMFSPYSVMCEMQRCTSGGTCPLSPAGSEYRDRWRDVLLLDTALQSRVWNLLQLSLCSNWRYAVLMGRESTWICKLSMKYANQKHAFVHVFINNTHVSAAVTSTMFSETQTLRQTQYTTTH